MMQWVLAFLLLCFLDGLEIRNGSFSEWIVVALIVAMFLSAIIACRIW